MGTQSPMRRCEGASLSRLATAAVVAICVCALIVVVADDEHAGQFADAVRIRIDSVKRSANNWRPWRSDRHQTIHSARKTQSLRDDELMGGSNEEDGSTLNSGQQAKILAELATQKRKLKAMLPSSSDEGEDEELFEEDESNVHRGNSALGDILTEEAEWPEYSRSHEGESEDSYESLLREAVAESRAAQKKAEADRRVVDLDEEEMEQEAVEDYRDKVLQKQRKKQAKQQAERNQLDHDRMEKKLVHEMAQGAAKDAARYTARHVAREVEQEVIRHVKHELPQRLSEQSRELTQQRPREGFPAPQLAPEAKSDLVPLEKSSHHPESHAQDDLQAMSAQIAQLKHKLKAVSQAAPQHTTPELSETDEVIPVEPRDDSDDSDSVQEDGAEEPEVVSEDVAPLVMESESQSESPQRVRSARASPVPVEAPSTGDEDVLHLQRQKPLEKPITVEEEAPAEEPTPDIVDEEGGETQTQAVYDIVTYLMWSSVGALLIGLLGTVVYCACQGPRDRPWGMPPKRF